MKIALTIFGLLLLLIVIIAGIGYALPVKHRASRAITLRASADTIFEALTNAAAFPEWRTGVKRVEMVSRLDGVTSYRETSDDGDILYVVDDLVAPRHMVTRIADDKLPFGGRWTYELTAGGAASTGTEPSVASAVIVSNGGPTQLRITEDGEVYNPMFRFVSHFVFGHHATIEAYLKDVARKFGQNVVITE